jgi:O-antigen/teichoic acid export membrane protein
MFANLVARRIDLLFVAHYQGAAAVGYYSVSVSIAEILLSIPSAISAPFMPLRFEMDHGEGRHFSSFVVKYVLLMMMLLCTAVGLLGKPLILIMYGQRFLPALQSLVFLLPGMVSLSIYQFLKADIYSLNRPGFISITSGVVMVVNLTLNYLLIPAHGIAGAAISSSISYTLSTAILIVFLVTRAGMPLKALFFISREEWRQMRGRGIRLVKKALRAGGKAADGNGDLGGGCTTKSPGGEGPAEGANRGSDALL